MTKIIATNNEFDVFVERVGYFRLTSGIDLFEGIFDSEKEEIFRFERVFETVIKQYEQLMDVQVIRLDKIELTSKLKLIFWALKEDDFKTFLEVNFINKGVTKFMKSDIVFFEFIVFYLYRFEYYEEALSLLEYLRDHFDTMLKLRDNEVRWQLSFCLYDFNNELDESLHTEVYYCEELERYVPVYVEIPDFSVFYTYRGTALRSIERVQKETLLKLTIHYCVEEILDFF